MKTGGTTRIKLFFGGFRFSKKDGERVDTWQKNDWCGPNGDVSNHEALAIWPYKEVTMYDGW